MISRTLTTRRAKFFTYRIDEIPSRYATAEQLMQCFHSDDKPNVHIKSFVPSISNPEDEEHTATLLYQSEGMPRLDADAENIELDKEFCGFTPLNSPCENVAADIIAVSGLGGHAFGSWVNTRGQMWLRDYLPKDLQDRARILVYGYPSALQDSHSSSSLGDYSTCFMQDLMGIRSQHCIQDRPIIFIGHSLGCLIIKKALSDLSNDVFSRLPIRSILFFGAPHAGLHIESLQTMVAGQPNENLVRDLGVHSSTLENLADSFEKIANAVKIYSFVETHETPVVEFIDGKWQRGSKRVMMVNKPSAKLRCGTETVRMVNADHSQMIKLRKGQGSDYPYIVSILKEALQSAPERWEHAKEEEQPEQEPENADQTSTTMDDGATSAQERSPQPGVPPKIPSQSAFAGWQFPQDSQPDSPPNFESQPSQDSTEPEGEEAAPPEYTPHPETPTGEEGYPPSKIEQLRAQLDEMQTTKDISDLSVQQVMISLVSELLLGESKENLIEAEEMIRSLLELQEEQVGPYHVFSLVYMECLADLLEKQKKFHDAEHFWMSLLTRASTAHGPSAEPTLKIVRKFIEFHLRRASFEKAESLCRQLLQLRIDDLGAGHRKTLDCEILLARCVSGKGEWLEAKTLLESSLSMLTTMLNEDDYQLLEPIELLATAYEQVGDFEESEEQCHRALDLMGELGYEETYPLRVLKGLKTLATAYERQGKHNEAHDALQDIFEGTESFEFATLEEWGISRPRILCCLGKQLSQMNNSLTEAEAKLQEASTLIQEHYGHFDYSDVLIETPQYLGRVYQQQGRLADAEVWLTHALNTCAIEAEECYKGTILADLGILRWKTGQLHLAGSTFQMASEAFRLNGNMIGAFDATSNFVQIQMELRNYVSAEQTLRTLLEQQKMESPGDNEKIFGTMELLAIVFDASGNPAAALEMRSTIQSVMQQEMATLNAAWNTAPTMSSHLAPPAMNQNQNGQTLSARNSMSQLSNGQTSYRQASGSYKHMSTGAIPNGMPTMPPGGPGDTLPLATTKTISSAFQDVLNVLYRLGISNETLQDQPNFRVLDCMDHGQSFSLVVKGLKDTILLQLSSASTGSTKHIISNIERLLAPTLTGNRVITYLRLVNDLGAGEVVRSTEWLLRDHGIIFEPMEGTPSRARHRCQLKKSRLFKSSKKVLFHVMHEIVPLDDTVMEISFEWLQGDRYVFDETVNGLIDGLAGLNPDPDDPDQEEPEYDDRGPQFDYNWQH